MASCRSQEIIPVIRQLWSVLRRTGLYNFHQIVSCYLFHHMLDYAKWIGLYDTLTDEDRNLIRQHIQNLCYQPFFSVIMPTYNTPERWLRRAIESVRNQLYPHWELCIADDASEKPHVRRVLEEYQAKDQRIKVMFRAKRGHISVASNSALMMAQGEFIVLLDHDDELPEHALYMVAVELNAHPEADVIFSDEDKIDEYGHRFNPYFKPEWDPELFLGQNCISHLGVYRTALVKEVGGFREGYEGAQDWDLAMRIVERIPASHIRHIPHVLYHWRTISGSAALSLLEKPYVQEAQRKTILSHFQRLGLRVEVQSVYGVHWRIRYPLPKPSPLVTIIIPFIGSSRNELGHLHRCIKSILRKTTYHNYEIVVVNRYDDPAMLQHLARLTGNSQIQVIHYHAPFNLSAISNHGARAARGEVLCFLDNDVEVITPDWLEEMVSHAVRPEVGAVGAMLYYPDGTIQHAGVILGIKEMVGHAYRCSPRGYPGHGGRAWLTQSLSAVTGACLVIRREIFDEVGGFDEQLTGAFNDIDLCLRLKQRGYRIIWTPFAKFIHHEEIRCVRNTIENPRFQQELAILKQRWGEIFMNDPAYNPNLTLEREDFSLAFPPRVRKPWLETVVPRLTGSELRA